MDTHLAYEELGLHPSASDAELKASWRRLVATWHPDRNGAADAGRRMQSINKAYQHIRQLREGAGEDVDAESNGPAEAEAEAAAAAQAAAEAAEAAAAAPLHTVVRSVRLTLEEAILGCTRTLSGHYRHPCTECVGKGQRVLAQACSSCHGSGAVHKAALFGWLWNQEACTDCGGDGRQRAPCAACDGQGEQSLAWRKRVRFPPGLRAGHVLEVPAARHAEGAARAGEGALELALELRLEIAPHDLFALDAEGVLRCAMPVNGYAWMAGHWVDVPTPEGLQQMRLNRDALVYRLRGQGFPTAVRGPRGDYLVTVTPVFPAEPDAAHEALLAQLIDSSNRAADAEPTQPLGAWRKRLQGR